MGIKSRGQKVPHSSMWTVPWFTGGRLICGTPKVILLGLPFLFVIQPLPCFLFPVFACSQWVYEHHNQLHEWKQQQYELHPQPLLEESPVTTLVYCIKAERKRPYFKPVESNHTYNNLTSVLNRASCPNSKCYHFAMLYMHYRKNNAKFSEKSQ